MYINGARKKCGGSVNAYSSMYLILRGNVIRYYRLSADTVACIILKGMHNV